MTKVTEEMNAAADMAEARKRRRAADEQTLTDILAGNPKLTKLLGTLDGLSGEGFSFTVGKGFSPADAGDVMENYRSPILVREVAVSGKAQDKLTVTLTLDGIYNVSSPNADSFATPVKNDAWKAADAWVVSQHSANPDLGIMSAFHRKEQQAVAKKPDQKPETPKAA